MGMTGSPKAVAAAALREDVGAWIHRHRNGPANLSYRQCAAVLAAECGVSVTSEAMRQWHVAHLAAVAAA